jgi:hypothetical protein
MTLSSSPDWVFSPGVAPTSFVELGAEEDVVCCAFASNDMSENRLLNTAK